jgi:hypothetical protein
MKCSCFMDCIQEILKCWCSSPLWIYYKYNPPYKISDFVQKNRKYCDTQYNTVDGLVRIKYYSKTDNKTIGTIYYRPFIGQILSFYIEREYVSNSLIEEILGVVIEDIKSKSITKEIWVIASKNHNLWTKIFNGGFSFKESVHESNPTNRYSMVLDS